MLEVVISWTYYKENVYFSSWNARQKKECVYFYDYDKYVWYIISQMDYSELQRFRLAIYQKYQKQIKFTPFREVDREWNIFEWYKLQSPNIIIDNTDFASLLPKDIRKRYFHWDNVIERYYMHSDFINYCELHNV